MKIKVWGNHYLTYKETYKHTRETRVFDYSLIFVQSYYYK